MYISGILLMVFVVVIAFRGQSGIWSNAIMLVNVIFAALLAMNYFEPLAKQIDSFDRTYRYLTDFLALWGVFAFSVLVMREITDRVSKVKVKFVKPVDMGVGGALACWIAWIMVCFAATTLHTAPLARNFLGFQPEPRTAMFFGLLAPDREWLGFTRAESVGPFSRSVSYRVGNQLTPAGPKEFDSTGDFIFKYGARREKFETVSGARVN